MTKGDKIRRVLERRDLDLTGEELEERWLNDNDDDSLRGLALEWNCQVLDCSLRDQGHLLDTETVRTKTKNLIDKELSMTESDLQERGIDLESVLDDFVTYQTIYSYLTLVRGVEYEPSPSGKSHAISTLSRACTKVELMAQSKLDARDIFAEGELTADVDCGAPCPSCEARASLTYWLVEEHCPQCGYGKRRSTKPIEPKGRD